MIANVLNRLRPPPPPGSATCPAQERVPKPHRPLPSSRGVPGLCCSRFTQGWAFRAKGAFYTIYLIKTPRAESSTGGSASAHSAPRAMPGAGGGRGSTAPVPGWFHVPAEVPGSPRGRGAWLGWMHACPAVSRCVHSPTWHPRPCQGQAGAAHPRPPPCSGTAVPSPRPSADTWGVCATPGARGGWGSPSAGMGGPCLESGRLLPVTSSPVSTATLKARSCRLTDGAAVTFLGDTQPVPLPGTPASNSSTQSPHPVAPRWHLGSPHSPVPALRPPKGADPSHQEGWDPPQSTPEPTPTS